MTRKPTLMIWDTRQPEGDGGPFTRHVFWTQEEAEAYLRQQGQEPHRFLVAPPPDIPAIHVSKDLAAGNASERWHVTIRVDGQLFYSSATYRPFDCDEAVKQVRFKLQRHGVTDV